MHRPHRRFHGPRPFMGHRPFMGPRPFFGPHPFMGGFGLIALFALFFAGRYWPIALVVFGISFLLFAVTRNRMPHPPPFDEEPVHPHHEPPLDHRPPHPLENMDPANMLPSTCPQCGGPIRSDSVKWTGERSASCPYCDANLPMIKPQRPQWNEE